MSTFGPLDEFGQGFPEAAIAGEWLFAGQNRQDVQTVRTGSTDPSQGIAHETNFLGGRRRRIRPIIESQRSTMDLSFDGDRVLGAIEDLEHMGTAEGDRRVAEDSSEPLQKFEVGGTPVVPDLGDRIVGEVDDFSLHPHSEHSAGLPAMPTKQ